MPTAEETPVRPADRDRVDPGASGAGSDEVVVRLTEDMLADGVADIRWALHDALVTGARRVVVDLRDVEHLSSPAAASLLTAHRACRARGGSVVVRGANRRTVGLLRRTGLWRVLGLEDLGRSA
ncbi:STAS domain-containing protein [Blastococcus sp. SYSU DS0619]